MCVEIFHVVPQTIRDDCADEAGQHLRVGLLAGVLVVDMHLRKPMVMEYPIEKICQVPTVNLVPFSSSLDIAR